MTIFAPHGTLVLTIEDNIILMEAKGPWNLEYVKDLHKQLGIAVAQVDNSNYGALFTPIGEAISVEEALDYHVSFLRQGNAKAIALNLDYCTTSQLTENLFNKIYRAAGIKHAFFDNAFDARVWLENELSTATL